MVILSQLEAGRRLARGVSLVLGDTPLVLAISAGGARVAAEMARVLGAPFDMMAGQRLEVPGRPHSVFGAVADGTVVLLADRIRQLELPPGYVDSLIELAREQVGRITATRRGSEQAIPFAGRSVVLVDDGSADAILVRSAATALREAGAKRLVFAAPLASMDLYQELQALVDDRVLLEEPGSTTQVRDPSFSQTTEFDIHDLVSSNRRSMSGSAQPI